MRVVFSPLAIRRLQEIHTYISDDNVTAATRVVYRIRQCIEMLADHPRLGRVWDDGRTRALSVSGLPYRIYYRLDETAGRVEILTIAHTSQLPPTLS